MNYSRYVMKGLYGSEFVVMKIELRLNHFFPDAFSIFKMIFTTQFHQPRLVIRTFHRQGRRSRGGHLCNEHSEEKYSCSYK